MALVPWVVWVAGAGLLLGSAALSRTHRWPARIWLLLGSPMLVAVALGIAKTVGRPDRDCTEHCVAGLPYVLSALVCLCALEAGTLVGCVVALSPGERWRMTGRRGPSPRGD